MVDTRHLKCRGRKPVPVQVRPAVNENWALHLAIGSFVSGVFGFEEGETMSSSKLKTAKGYESRVRESNTVKLVKTVNCQQIRHLYA